MTAEQLQRVAASTANLDKGSNDCREVTKGFAMTAEQLQRVAASSGRVLYDCREVTKGL